jgi:hypothetical protein
LGGLDASKGIVSVPSVPLDVDDKGEAVFVSSSFENDITETRFVTKS